MENQVQVQFDDKKVFEGIKEIKGGTDELFEAVMGDDVKRVVADIKRVITDFEKGQEPVGDLIALAADAYNLVKHNEPFRKAITDIVTGARKVGEAFVS